MRCGKQPRAPAKGFEEITTPAIWAAPERGERSPPGVAAMLLKVMVRDPQLVVREAELAAVARER